MAGVKGKSGGPRPGSGRKSKAEEQSLVEKLGPLEEVAHKQLATALRRGDRWAVEMYFGYMYGKPRHRVEQSGPDGEAIQHEIKELPSYTDDEVMSLAEQIAAYRKANENAQL